MNRLAARFGLWLDHSREPFNTPDLDRRRVRSIRRGIADAYAGKTRLASDVFAELGIDLDAL